jgi:hypothetical protein
MKNLNFGNALLQMSTRKIVISWILVQPAFIPWIGTFLGLNLRCSSSSSGGEEPS